jgi:spore coat protein U-like protein
MNVSFKRNIVVVFATSLSCVALFAGGASATTSKTADLVVSAQVNANCTISTTALDFGVYDPVATNALVASVKTGTGGIVVSCTKGWPSKVTLGEGANKDSASSASAPVRNMTNGTDLLAYSLYQDNTSTPTVWGNTDATGVAFLGNGSSTSTLAVYGKIPGAQNVSQGTYTDTVVATLTF